MADAKNVQKQLKKLKFGGSGWNQAELRELPHILHDHEAIEECVNGFYDGGVALLVATDARILLIDKKPLNYLNVEDLRFDMINEIDYSHRLMGATIIISTGSKTLKFKSYNQTRLRHLINVVQERMSLNKKQQSEQADNQQQHLEEINKQLQMYLLAQHQQLQSQINSGNAAPNDTSTMPKPNPQLADYLFAQRLMEQLQKNNGLPAAGQTSEPAEAAAPSTQTDFSQQLIQTAAEPASAETPQVSQAELLADAQQEVFGNKPAAADHDAPAEQSAAPSLPNLISRGIEISPLRIAYAKLPMLLRNRRFGRPTFSAANQQPLQDVS